jgi:hypothetical protein
MSYTISYLPTNEATVKARRYFVADTAAELPTVAPAVDGDIGYAKDTDSFSTYNGTIWQVGGSRQAYVTKSGNYTLTLADYYVEVTVASTMTLPTAASISGRSYVIKATVDNVVVATTGGQTIDGESTKTLMQYDSMSVYSNGSNWSVF